MPSHKTTNAKNSNANNLNANQANDKGDTRIELLDEAARVLNKRGVSQASLRLIAKNVGVSRAALYYYFDDQQDLVYQCYARACEQLAELLAQSVKRNSNALSIIDDFIASAFDENRPEFASLSDIAFLREEQHSLLLSLYKEVRSSLSNIIREGINQGQLRSCDSRIVSSTILGAIAWVPICMRWVPEKTENYVILRESLREIIKFGIARKRPAADADSDYERFDISSFLIDTGSVFDADARLNARRETLIIVASWLFNQKGIDATSLDEIASKVGVTKKVIYHNIGGKDVLITECYRRAFRFFQFVADCADNTNGSRVNSVCRSLATLAAASLRQDIAPLVPIAGHESWSKEDGEDLQALVVSLIEQGENLFQQGIDDGSIRSLTLQPLLMLRPGFYEWMPRWGGSLDEIELQQASIELTKVYRLGIAPLDK